MATANPLRIDPTRTITLRKQFERAVTRRFYEFKRKVLELVVDEDEFGLSNKPDMPLVMNAGKYKFESNDAKVKLFQAWLLKELQDIVDEQKQNQQEDYWEEYVKQGYEKGAKRSYEDAVKKGVVETDDFYLGGQKQFLNDAFNHPVSIDKVKLLAARVFTELKGVNETMASQLSRSLTDGLVQGKSPRDVGRDMFKVMEISKKRALTIARTETIRAHAEGQLMSLEKLGVTEVGVMVEWATAKDDKVCKQCQPLDGVVLKINEAQGMIPRHPNCRCAWVPANVGEDKTKQIRGRDNILEAVKKSAQAEKPKAEDPLKESRWAGTDKKIHVARPPGVLDKPLKEKKKPGPKEKEVQGPLPVQGPVKPPVPTQEPPKPTPAAKPPLPAPKPVGLHPDNVTFIKTLPGSTSPKLVKDADGKLWVMKEAKKGTEDHVRSEALADEMYRLAGIKVPKSQLVETEDGPVKFAEFIEGGQTLSQWKAGKTPEQIAAMNVKIKEGMVMDAWMANWDAIGLTEDNVLIVNGEPQRIDNGGALEYRAQGQPKGDKFEPGIVPEMTSLFDKNVNASAANAYAGITDEEVKKQVQHLVANKEKILANVPADLRKKMEYRLDYLDHKYNKKIDQTLESNKFISKAAAKQVVGELPKPSPELQKQVDNLHKIDKEDLDIYFEAVKKGQTESAKEWETYLSDEKGITVKDGKIISIDESKTINGKLASQADAIWDKLEAEGIHDSKGNVVDMKSKSKATAAPAPVPTLKTPRKSAEAQQGPGVGKLNYAKAATTDVGKLKELSKDYDALPQEAKNRLEFYFNAVETGKVNFAKAVAEMLADDFGIKVENGKLVSVPKPPRKQTKETIQEAIDNLNPSTKQLLGWYQNAHKTSGEDDASTKALALELKLQNVNVKNGQVIGINDKTFGVPVATPKPKVDQVKVQTESLKYKESVAHRRDPKQPLQSAYRIDKKLSNQVEDARVNGRNLAADEGDIEDNNILVYTDVQDGKTMTRLYMKLTEQGDQKLRKNLALEESAKQVNTRHSDDVYYEKVMLMAKTVNGKAKYFQAGSYNEGVLLKTQIEAELANKPDKQKQEMLEHYKKLIEEYEDVYVKKGNVDQSYVAGAVVEQYQVKPDKSKLPKDIKVKTKGQIEVNTASIRDGRSERDATAANRYGGTMLQVDIADAKMMYVPNDRHLIQKEAYGTHYVAPGKSFMGVVEVAIEGKPTPENIKKGLAVLQRAGIDTKAPSEAKEEALYLWKNIYLTKQHTDPEAKKIWNSTASDEEKVKQLKEWWQAKGVVLPDKPSGSYNPIGKTKNSFGQGFRHWDRFDIPPEKMEKEMKGYVLMHQISQKMEMEDFVDKILQSGGELTPTNQRVRKGVGVNVTGGMSSDEDVRTGGADYFFTRIRPEGRDTTKRTFTMKIRNLARMDAISYSSDKYGDSNKVDERLSTIDQYKNVASSSENETILKHGLSFIDEVDKIYVGSEKQKKDVIDAFKRNKIDVLPDGRKVEDIVINP